MKLTPIDYDPFAAPSARLTPVDYDPFAQPETPERSWGDALSDRALGVGAAGFDIIRAAANFANTVGGDAPRSEFVHSFGETAGAYAKDARAAQSPVEQALQRGLGEAMASESGILDQAGAVGGYLVDNPAALGQVFDSLIPSMAAGGAPVKIAKALGAGIPAMTAVGLGGQSAVGGLMSGQGAADAVADPRALQSIVTSPEYAEALQVAEGDHGRALQYLEARAMDMGAGTGFLANLALLGAGQKLGLNVIEDAIVGRVTPGLNRLAGAMLGGAKETVGEGLQGGVDQVAQNLGEMAGGLPTQITDDLGGSMLLEALAGYPAGMIAGATNVAPDVAPQPAPQQAPQPAPAAPNVGPDVAVEAAPDEGAELDALIQKSLGDVLATPEGQEAAAAVLAAVAPEVAPEGLGAAMLAPESAQAVPVPPVAARPVVPEIVAAAPSEPAPIDLGPDPSDSTEARQSMLLDLENEIGWEQVGGRMIRGQERPNDGMQAEVTGRTNWVGRTGANGQESTFWRDRPVKISEAEAKRAFEKLRNGEKLTAKESRFIDYANQAVDQRMADMREDAELVRAESVQALRDDGIEFDPADDDEAATLAQWVERAYDAGADPTQILDATFDAAPDVSARNLAQLVEGLSNGTVQRAEAGNRAVGVETQGVAESGDLFAIPTQAERIAAARREKDAARNGLNRDGRTDMLAGDGELFAGPRPEQADIEGSRVSASSRDMFVPTRGDRERASNEQDRNGRQDAGSGRSGAQRDDAGADGLRADATPSLTRRGEFEVDALLRRFGGSVLADTIARDFREARPAQLVGQEVKTPQDLAALAQVYRSPIFETLRYVFVDRNGKVLGETAVSSRMPSASVAFPTDKNQWWLAEQIEQFQASGYYLIHNHPSGNPQPSLADARLTQSLAQTIPGFKGHIVINHKMYAHIRADGSHTLGVMDGAGSPDPLRQKYGPAVGKEITGPDSAALIAADLYALTPKDSVAFIVTGARNEVNFAATIPERALRGARGATLLSQLAKRSSSSMNFLVMSKDQYLQYGPLVKKAMGSGLIIDAVFVDTTGKVDTSGGHGGYFSRVLERGGRGNRGQVVREKEAGYTDQAKPLTEEKFYDRYWRHIDFASRNDPSQAERNKAAVIRDGFKKSSMANVMQTRPPSDWDNSFDARQRRAGALAIRPGDTVYLVPRSALLRDRPVIREGWRPEPWEVVTIQDGESLYDAYIRAFNDAGNSGAFDPSNQSIVREDPVGYASKRNAQVRAEAAKTLGASQGAAGWKYDEGKWEGRKGALSRWRRALDDKMLAWKDAQQQIEAQRGEILPDAENVYRLETLMHGRVSDRLDSLERDQIVPLVEAMRAAGVKPAELEQYLYARHAEERNKQIASINPRMPDGGSGMTTAEANEILSKADRAKLEPLAKRADAIAKATRRRMLENGLITQEAFDAMEAQYKHYVPLRGKSVKETEFKAGEGGAGRGIDTRRNPVREALGRGEGNMATDILGHLIADAQRSIILAEKARVGRAVMRAVLANPNPDLWTVEPVQTEFRKNAAGEVYEAVIQDWSDPHIIAVKHRGKTYKVEIRSEPLARALNHVGIDQIDGVFRALGMINRYFSAVLTKYNPSFIPANASRDAIFGLTGLAAEHGSLAALEAAAIYPRAIAAAHRKARGKSGSSDYDKWADEFTAAGGKTGYVNMPSVEDLAAKIGSGKLSSYSPTGGMRAARALGDFIEAANDAVENALRLSAFIVLRKRGASAEQAAEYAKNITVNFNRKGEAGSKLNALFLFYNASIQGAKRAGTVMRQPKAMAVVAGLASLQAIAAMFAMGMEDDEGEELWDKVPDHVKRRNVVFVSPDGGLVTIPMPYGFNVLTYLAGRAVGAAMDTEGRPENRAMSLAADTMSAVSESFLPIPVADGAMGLAPTVVRIPLNVQSNRDDFGRKIRNENPYSKWDVPRASMGRTDTLELFKFTANGLNRLGGGDDYTPPPMSFFDVAPEDLEYLTKELTGGTGKFFLDIATLGEMAVGSAPIAAKNVPVTNRFVSNIDEQASQQAAFYNRRDVIERSLSRVRDVFEEQGPDAALALMQGMPELRGAFFMKKKDGGYRMTDGRPHISGQEDSVFGAYKVASKRVSDLNDQIKKAYTDAPPSLIPTKQTIERDRRVREIAKEREAAQKAFAEAWVRDVVGVAE